MEYSDVEKGVRQITCLSEELWDFALEQKIELVPVVMHGETRRYYIFYLKRVQIFFYTWIGYPFPLLFFLKIFSQTKPPLLKQQFGAIIECTGKYDKATLKESFGDAISALADQKLGDDILKFS